MTHERETFVRMCTEAVQRMHDELGAWAFVILGALLASAVLTAVLIVRWIVRGGLRRRV